MADTETDIEFETDDELQELLPDEEYDPVVLAYRVGDHRRFVRLRRSEMRADPGLVVVIQLQPGSERALRRDQAFGFQRGIGRRVGQGNVSLEPRIVVLSGFKRTGHCLLPCYLSGNGVVATLGGHKGSG